MFYMLHGLSINKCMFFLFTKKSVTDKEMYSMLTYNDITYSISGLTPMSKLLNYSNKKSK